jgi:hypothetical protein
MTEKLQQQMKEEIAKLPEVRQKAINAFDWAKMAEEIGKKNSLIEDEIANFQLETGLVLIGLATSAEYARNIENNVGVGAEEAKKISIEALEKIFIPVINRMEASVKENFGSKSQTWDQTVQFILSGGDYSTFLEK